MRESRAWTIIWPPNGVLLAFLLRVGERGWVPLAAAALAAEIAADVPTFGVAEAVMFGVINVCEAMAARSLLVRWHFNPQFAAASDLLKFAVAGPGVAAFAGAAAGAFVYMTFRGGATTYLEFMRTWWFGDAVGLMIVTPLILAVWHRTRELEVALSEVKRLHGLLPMCAWCKKIRDDYDYWHSVEDYISRRTGAQFSHGICPECAESVARRNRV